MKMNSKLIRRTLLAGSIAALFAAPAGATTITINTIGNTVGDESICSLRVVRGAVSTAINNGRGYVTAGVGGMSVLK
jgi:hypothetical protein